MSNQDLPAPIDLRWLLTLRWAAIAGQLATIAAVELSLDVGLPILPLMGVIATEAVSNLVARFRLDDPGAQEWLPASLLTIDVLALTGLLYLSGGPHNPFNFLYLVYIALAAVVLRPTATWGLAALSAASFGALFFDSVPLEALGGHGAMDHGGGMDHSAHAGMDHSAHAGMDHSAHAGMEASTTQPAAGADPMDLHLRGMWVAFTVGAAFIVYFVTRVKTALAERDVALTRARQTAANAEKLASLATLAGGAAHELATPLGTIAIVAKELQLDLEQQNAAASAVDDVKLIRSQVDRCRSVLDQLAIDAGENPGESREDVALGLLVEGALAEIERRDQVQVQVPDTLETVTLRGFPTAMEQTLRAVLRNALDASEASRTPVVLHATGKGSEVLVTVTDEGLGMDDATLARATEPFFTTKEEGKGMGLGLFLGQTVLERQGGRLTIQSTVGQGTTVQLWFPVATNS